LTKLIYSKRAPFFQMEFRIVSFVNFIDYLGYFRYPMEIENWLQNA